MCQVYRRGSPASQGKAPNEAPIRKGSGSRKANFGNFQGSSILLTKLFNQQVRMKRESAKEGQQIPKMWIAGRVLRHATKENRISDVKDVGLIFARR